MRCVELFKGFIHASQIGQPFVIAEAGVNHGGDMNIARRLIEEAKEGGADAIKFQTYRAETIASRNSPAYWDTTREPTLSQFELFKKYDRFWTNEFEQLKRHCDDIGIEFMSTPFDVESALFLSDLMDVYKISSSDITNKPFIEYICSFHKPIILSTGASNMDEIEEAVSWIEAKGNKLALLHCILNYPTNDASANLGMIRSLQKNFPKNLIGYSDHTLPGEMKVLEVATLLGAVILEKHFTHDKRLPGNDHYHAMDKGDLKRFRSNMQEVLHLVGCHEKAALDSEEPARQNARRSLIASHNIKSGDAIKAKDLTFKRPASGISPKEIGKVVGRTACRNIGEDEVLQWKMIE